MWKTVVAYQKVIFARLDVAVERALETCYFSKGEFNDHRTYEWYCKSLNKFSHSFETAQNFSKLVKPIEDYHVATVSGINLTTIIKRYRYQMYRTCKLPKPHAPKLGTGLTT